MGNALSRYAAHEKFGVQTVHIKICALQQLLVGCWVRYQGVVNHSEKSCY